jgi:hypothetical protein
MPILLLSSRQTEDQMVVTITIKDEQYLDEQLFLWLKSEERPSAKYV